MLRHFWEIAKEEAEYPLFELFKRRLTFFHDPQKLCENTSLKDSYELVLRHYKTHELDERFLSGFSEDERERCLNYIKLRNEIHWKTTSAIQALGILSDDDHRTMMTDLLAIYGVLCLIAFISYDEAAENEALNRVVDESTKYLLHRRPSENSREFLSIIDELLNVLTPKEREQNPYLITGLHTAKAEFVQLMVQMKREAELLGWEEKHDNEDQKVVLQ
jgi:hypothetical protein